MLRALALSLCLVCPAIAQPPAWQGAEDPAFAEARDAWLSGTDDMNALARLAALAQSGNAAAQVLLGTVVAEGLVPPAVDALPRAERIALTRAPGGLSGTSWLRVAAQEDAVAMAIGTVVTGFPEANVPGIAETLQTLLDAGETGAAVRALIYLGNIGGGGPDGGWTLVARHGAHPALQGHAVPLLALLRTTLTDPASGVSDPALLAAVEVTLGGLPNPATLHGPLATVCATACPEAPAACTAAVVRVTGGHVGYVTLSPVEGLIDSATYQASPRFVHDLGQRLSGAAEALVSYDSCAGRLVP